MTLLVLMLLFTSPTAAIGPQPVVELPEPDIELCDLARELARQPPCLAAGDCQAEKLWRRTFGPPGVVLAPPGSRPARAASFPMRRGAELELREWLRLTLRNCPAPTGASRAAHR